MNLMKSTTLVSLLTQSTFLRFPFSETSKMTEGSISMIA
jgi:hypothetical protein